MTDAAKGDAPNKWIITFTVLTGTFMAVLDTSIVNVALPTMSGTLGASTEEITWVVTGYLLSNVVIMPIIALLSARFGRKRFYMANVLLFTGASMLCGLARTLPTMVACRIVQGIGGGVLTTVSQAILRETFPPEEQGLAMGFYGMGVVVAPAIGPTLGGWLTDNYDWPWVFYINVPIGILNLLLVHRFIADPPDFRRDTGSIDWAGVAFMTVGLSALQLMLERGQREAWFQSNEIVALALIAAVGLVAFAVRELRVERPAVNLRLLANVSFSSATLLGGVLGLALQGSLFLLPVYLQTVLGYPAMDSGLALMPRSAAMIVLMPLGGRLYNRLGPRWLVGTGLVVSGLSFWDLAHLTADTGFWDLFWPQLWQGVGFSLLFVALSTAALAHIPRPDITAATGLYSVVRQVAGSIGIALSATMLANETVRNRAYLVSNLSITDPKVQNALAAMQAQVATTMPQADPTAAALAMLNGRASLQGHVIAYNDVFGAAALCFAIGLPLTFLLRGGGDAHETVHAE